MSTTSAGTAVSIKVHSRNNPIVEREKKNELDGFKRNYKAYAWLSLATFVSITSIAIATAVSWSNSGSKGVQLYYPHNFYFHGDHNALSTGIVAPGGDPDNAAVGWLKRYQASAKQLMNICGSTDLKIYTGVVEWNDRPFTIHPSPVQYGKWEPYSITSAALWVTAAFALLRFVGWWVGSLMFPDAPYYLRWFEYAITSPLIVIVVALGVGIRDISTLAALAAGQGMLVLVGYLLEKEIETILRTRYWRIFAMTESIIASKEDQTGGTRITRSGTSQRQYQSRRQEDTESLLGDRKPTTKEQVQDILAQGDHEADALIIALMTTQIDPQSLWTTMSETLNLCQINFSAKRGVAGFKILSMHILAWLAFAAIWATLIAQFQSSVNSFTCDADPKVGGEMPPAIAALLWIQMVCFALYGVVAVVQFIYAWSKTSKGRGTDRESSNSNVPLTTMWERYTTYMEMREDTYMYASIAYEFLNLFSKATLGVCVMVVSGQV